MDNRCLLLQKEQLMDMTLEQMKSLLREGDRLVFFDGKIVKLSILIETIELAKSTINN